LSEITHDDTYGLAHHFDNMEQQKDATTLGMWIFLATEIMFFGGVFLVYTVYRFAHYASSNVGSSNHAFLEGSNHLDWKLGAVNTIVLICSSLTMALAVHAAQLGKQKRIVGFLILTIIFGLVFLGIKSVEYSHKFHDHLVPGPNFTKTLFGPGSQQAQIFFSLYFSITGIHAVHMIVGIVILGILAYQASKGKYTAGYHAPIELSGLYWHFVDIAWIFIFPLLYLFGRNL
jgi:cytochrome c oxidase subunit III